MEFGHLESGPIISALVRVATEITHLKLAAPRKFPISQQKSRSSYLEMTSNPSKTDKQKIPASFEHWGDWGRHRGATSQRRRGTGSGAAEARKAQPLASSSSRSSMGYTPGNWERYDDTRNFPPTDL